MIGHISGENPFHPEKWKDLAGSEILIPLSPTTISISLFCVPFHCQSRDMYHVPWFKQGPRIGNCFRLSVWSHARSRSSKASLVHFHWFGQRTTSSFQFGNTQSALQPLPVSETSKKRGRERGKRRLWPIPLVWLRDERVDLSKRPLRSSEP